MIRSWRSWMALMGLVWFVAEKGCITDSHPQSVTPETGVQSLHQHFASLCSPFISLHFGFLLKGTVLLTCSAVYLSNDFVVSSWVYWRDWLERCLPSLRYNWTRWQLAHGAQSGDDAVLQEIMTQLLKIILTLFWTVSCRDHFLYTELHPSAVHVCRTTRPSTHG